eukprot:gb/GECH01001369.1/.p1 GENE.gb/GECH01001369.1/~~gb/GECH01001369.1/.p1  ORF type:complete len:469 (+),score=77.76 gb/GECH01001369.1/:1-1407(+)
MVANFGTNDIPDELCISIFSFLDSNTVLWKLRAVCSEWRHLALKAITEVSIVGSKINSSRDNCHFTDTMNSIQWSVNSFPNLNHIGLTSFGYITLNNIRKIFTYYRSMETLSLNHSHFASNVFSFTPFIPSISEIVSMKRLTRSSLSHLELLSLSNCKADQIVKLATSSGARIQRLTISESLINPSVQFPSTLRELRLNFDIKLFTLNFLQIFELPKLEYFYYNGSVDMTQEPHRASSRSVLKLVHKLGKKFGTNFDIDSSNASPESSLSLLTPPKTPHPLKSLILSIHDMSFKLFKYILSFLTNLEELKLISTKLDARDLEIIRMPYLKELNTTTMVKFNTPRLRKLDIHGSQVLEWLNKHQFPDLRQITIEAHIVVDSRDFSIPAYSLLEHLVVTVTQNIHHINLFDCPNLVTIRFPNAKISSESVPSIASYVQELWDRLPKLKLIVIKNVELNPNRRQFPEHRFS